MARQCPDLGQPPATLVKTRYYAKTAEGWPDVVICVPSQAWPFGRRTVFAIFCETDAELLEAAEALIFPPPEHLSASAAARRLLGLCAGPSALSEEGLAIYVPMSAGDPWLYLEAIELGDKKGFRGRYSWRTFVGLNEACAHMEKRWRHLSPPADGSGSYRRLPMMLPMLPRFMPGPWE
jgi:hypothetical protein